VRPDDDAEFPFDHCSIIRTVLDLFVGTEACLTERDYQAPSIAPRLLSKARDGDLGPNPLYRKEPPTDDPTKKRPQGGQRKGCHSVAHLMEMTDETFKTEDDEDDSADDPTGWLIGKMAPGRKKKGAPWTIGGFSSHLATYNALMNADLTDGTLEEEIEARQLAYES